jgi:CBS domain containing-hemolysin-like protein
MGEPPSRRAQGSHLAAVTGDKGTVIGFVTMEDVLSEPVGGESGGRNFPGERIVST